MDNHRPFWITMAQRAVRMLSNNRGEVNAGDPPAGDPPAGDPPSGDPPAPLPPPAAPVDWTETLPAEQKALLGVKGWKAPQDIIKGYSELEKLVGHEKIAMPKKDKDGNYEKGEFERVMSQLGLPKDAKDYTEAKDFKLAEGVSLDAKLMENFKVEARQAGLLPSQYAFVMNKFANLLNSGVSIQKEQTEKSHNESVLNLRNKWGVAYDSKAAIAQNVLNNFADEKTKAEIVKRYGNDPAIVELLANVGSNLSEDVLKSDGMKGSLMTPEGAKMEIDKIRNERSKELNDAQNPQHKYWVNRLSELYNMQGA